MANLIPRALSDRAPRADGKDLVDYVTRELQPLLKDIREALNNQQAAVTAPTGGATIDVEARAAIVAIIDRLSGFGVTP